MEPRFELRLRMDGRLLRKVFRATSRWRQPVLWVCVALTGGAVLVDVANGRIPSAMGTVLFCVLVAVSWVRSARWMARMAERRHRQRFGGELPEVEIRFSDEGIRLRERKDEQHFEYAQVRRIIRRDGLWVLRVAGRLAIPVPDESFVRGSSDEFEAFLRAKCPAAGPRR